MKAKHHKWWVFTPYGIFSAEGPSARIALRQFQSAHHDYEVLGIFRDDLVIKPPAGPGAPAYVCMFTQGPLSPKPNPEEGK